MKHTKPRPKAESSIDLFDKTLGCMKGKAIGGTLGTPVEGRMEVLDLTFYDPVPSGILPNDDLDLQLSALECVEAHGGFVHRNHLARMWREQVRFPWDEYGCGKANLERGLLPPVSGWYDNPFADCMGSPIRSELWAMLAPGRPALAAHFAWQDACVDHGLEGIAGEMFYAALESAAMVTPARDVDWVNLIEIGLSHTPKKSRVYQALAFTLKAFPRHPDWKTLRRAILDGHGHPNFTDAPQNLAFSILGLLYHPDDFAKALLLTTNCGYDTDCTAATIGAIWGAAKGDAFPEAWLTPIGNALTASHPVVDLGLEADLEGLCRRVCRLSGKVLSRYGKLTETNLKKITADDMARPERVVLGEDFSIQVDLAKGPVLTHPGTVSVDVKGPVKAAHVREPFTVRKAGPRVTVTSGSATGYTPRRAGVALETRGGAFHHLDLVTAHELLLAERKDGDAFADLAKAPHHADPAFKPFVMKDRSLDLRKTGKGPWIQLSGFIHLGDFIKYRFFPSAECAVEGYLDGKRLVKVDEALPNIPAPHRCQNQKQFADLELRAGWHRLDLFLNRGRTIRDGGFTLVLADAYTKQLVPFKIHRTMGGVYAHGLPKIGS